MLLRPTLLVLLIISSSHYCHSQLRNFGVKAGFNVSNASGVDESSKKIGYHLGVVGMVRINDTWILQPEILFSDQGCNVNDTKYNLRYFALPLLFKYQYKDFFFDFGSQASILFNATRVNEESQMKKVEITGQMSNVDFSLVTGVGFMASKHIGVEGRIVLGLSDASQNEDVQWFNNAFQLSAFYTFK